MAKSKKILVYLFLFMLFCNLPWVTGIFNLLIGDPIGLPFGFVTRDLHLYASGGIELIQDSDLHKKYMTDYPNEDHTLYRVFPARRYGEFWMYGRYLFNPNWRAPFLELPSDFSSDRYNRNNRDDNPSFKWDEKTNKWVKLNS